MITLLYFAGLRESLGTGSETLALPAQVSTLEELRAYLRARGGPWANALDPARNVRMAVNQDMAGGSSPVRDGDEIAFFPPVTGG